MEKTMSKRSKIRAFSFAAAVLLTLSVFAISGTVRANRLQRQLRVTGERALCDLDTYLNNIQVNLEKGVYANTPPMIGTVATDLWREATGAKSSLAALPLNEARLDNTYKFLSQVGDFVMALNKKVERGETITDEERTNMQKLLSFAQSLSTEVSAMRQELFDGVLNFESAESTLDSNANEISSLSADMESAQQALTDYPTLIYDGPFSDHINQTQSVLLENAAEISQDEAMKKAGDILGVATDEIEFFADEDDNSAAFCFQCGDTTIAITRRGGYLLYMLSSKYAGEEKLNYEDAKRYAAEFLEKSGFHDMQESYYSVSDGICTLNFAYTDGEYVCYPDLIKVSVSLEDGKILSADCRGYIMNHKDRTIPVPAITAAEAQKNISSLLTVMRTRLAVIPTNSQTEKYTYEVHCKNADGAEFLVYIDTTTGYEDDILLLLYADGGVLTK